MVDVSNSPLRDPCVPITAVGESGEACGFPISTLAPNGVLISWSEDGLPGMSLAKESGRPLTLGGLPAREAITTVTGPGYCTPINGTEMISVWVARTIPYNLFEAQACLRGPDTTLLAAAVNQLLLSVSFTQP